MKHLKENRILKQEALELLKDNWSIAVSVSAIFMFVNIISSKVPFSLFFTIPITIGIINFYLNLSRGKTLEVSSIFSYFNNRYLVYIWNSILVLIRIALWSLLLIIPGIIAAISYSQSYFILAEDNSISAIETIERSKKMMYGYKWKYFLLLLSFIGWGLLSIISLGIGFLWLIPYMYVTQAKFYDNLKKHHI